ncbi:unnamed protein product [Eruca vesicaria subsp. sativa]|uniref:Uncharacterized protein n=1 Tax=Eruca vesicaria subsp. sativa TaxID=29727 RepID=A0ABC8IV26_ERUVS|nr:unnamed protein product [Eruca vesicaria subsp. sativa]
MTLLTFDNGGGDRSGGYSGGGRSGGYSGRGRDEEERMAVAVVILVVAEEETMAVAVDTAELVKLPQPSGKKTTFDD